MSFVPGMTGLGSSNKAPPRLPLTNVLKVNQSVSANTASLAWPTGIRAGDLALLYDWCFVENNGGLPSLVVPSGFTPFHQGTGTSGEIDGTDFGQTRVVISHRILDGSESEEEALTGMVGNRGEAKIMMLFRGNVRIRSVTSKSRNSYIDFGNPPAQTITASSGQVPLIAYGFTARNTATQSFITNSPAFSEIISAGYGAIGGYRIYTTSPVDHSVDGHSGSGDTETYGLNLFSGYLELA